jgi:hypothetical protein
MDRQIATRKRRSVNAKLREKRQSFLCQHLLNPQMNVLSRIAMPVGASGEVHCVRPLALLPS